MTVPALKWGEECCPRISKAPWALAAAVILDVILMIGSLAAGALGIQGMIPLAPAASYALIGVGSGVILLWIGLIITRICPLRHCMEINT